jgi:hypothetical protein
MSGKAEAEKAHKALPSLTQDEFYKALEKGERWFHNGGTRERYVLGIAGFFTHYKSKPESNTTSGVVTGDFIKWAKGIGRLNKEESK